MTTLKEFKDEFLLWSIGAHRPKTQKANDLALRKFAAFLKDENIELNAIPPKSADLFMANEIKLGNKQTTANNYFRHLKLAFRKAVAWGYIKESVFDKTKQFRVDEEEPKYLDEQQMVKFLEGIEDPPGAALDRGLSGYRTAAVRDGRAEMGGC